MAAGSDTARQVLRLVSVGQFARLFWGKLAGSTAIWIHGIAASIALYEATGSAFVVSLVSVVQFLPLVFLTPSSGAYADRGFEWAQMVSGRVFCAAGSGISATWFLVRGEPRGEALTLVVLSSTLLVGVGLVIGEPAAQSVITLLVEPNELHTAMAMNTLPMTIARVVGPIAAAVLVAGWGVGTAFVVAACLNALFVAMLLMVVIPARPRRSASAEGSALTALRHVVSDRPLILGLLAVACTAIGAEPALTLAPSLAAEFSSGPGAVGVLTAGFGGGAVAGGLVLASLGARVPAANATSGGLAATMLGLILVAGAGAEALVITGLALAGIGFSWTTAGASTLIQVRAPELMRGRIMAVWLLAFVGVRPFGAAGLGALADATGVRTAVVALAGVVLVVLFLCMPRYLDPPDFAEAAP